MVFYRHWLSREENDARAEQARKQREAKEKKRLRGVKHRRQEHLAKQKRENYRYWKSITEFDPNRP